MKGTILFTGLMLIAALVHAQIGNNSSDSLYLNSAGRLLKMKGNLKIGGYGGVHYNHPLKGGVRKNGNLDVHRFIMMMGYRFNSRTQFITELEFEHVKEVYVEQAFLQYKLNKYMNFRAGLVLIPMGIINQYHEPTTFNGVERPKLSHDIVPSTWREAGLGFSGLILPLSLKYQAYLVNGFNSFDGKAHIGGAAGLRDGRQKAAKSFMSSPNVTAKVEYFGISNLNVGLSGYFGKTQSTLYNGIDKDDDKALATADSSVVDIAMIGADMRYSVKGLKLSGQFYYNGLSNTNEYNEFTADKEGGDLGSSMFGYYADLGYNVFRGLDTDKKLIPFVRYSNYDTHYSVESIAKNKAYQKDVFTTGLSLYFAKGAVLKTDIQFVKDGTSNTYEKTFNAGIGVMF